MAGQPWLRTVTALVLFALAIQCTSALQVEFYSEKNYSGYAGGFQKAPGHDTDCYTLDERLEIKSMRTDNCLMLYVKPDCKRGTDEDEQEGHHDYYSYRVDNDTSEFLISHPFLDDSYYLWYRFRKVQSFHKCSQERGGGPALDVDYYTRTDYTGVDAGQWRNVCICQNVPENMRRGKKNLISIDNHGNDIELFPEENCQGFSISILGGDNEYAWIVPWSVLGGNDVVSFRPIGLHQCMKLDSSIYEFYFKNGTSDPPIPKKVKLAATGYIINKGAAETTQTYTLSESIAETVEFSIASSYTTMNNVGVSATVSIKGDVGVPLVAEAEVTASITADYHYQWGSSTQNTTTNTVTKTTTIQETQTIVVPGCHNCTINAFVKQAKNFPIKYESYSQISGYAGSTRLDSSQLKNNLPNGATYVKDIDDYTVAAVVEGTMYAQFGLQTFMDIECDKIPDCTPNAVYKGPTTFHYEIPVKATKKRGWEATATPKDNNNIDIGTSMGNNWNSLSEACFAF